MKIVLVRIHIALFSNKVMAHIIILCAEYGNLGLKEIVKMLLQRMKQEGIRKNIIRRKLDIGIPMRE